MIESKFVSGSCNGAFNDICKESVFGTKFNFDLLVGNKTSGELTVVDFRFVVTGNVGDCTCADCCVRTIRSKIEGVFFRAGIVRSGNNCAKFVVAADCEHGGCRILQGNCCFDVLTADRTCQRYVLSTEFKEVSAAVCSFEFSVCRLREIFRSSKIFSAHFACCVVHFFVGCLIESKLVGCVYGRSFDNFGKEYVFQALASGNSKLVVFGCRFALIGEFCNDSHVNGTVGGGSYNALSVFHLDVVGVVAFNFPSNGCFFVVVGSRAWKVKIFVDGVFVLFEIEVVGNIKNVDGFYSYDKVFCGSAESNRQSDFFDAGFGTNNFCKEIFLSLFNHNVFFVGSPNSVELTNFVGQNKFFVDGLSFYVQDVQLQRLFFGTVTSCEQTQQAQTNHCKCKHY